MVRDGGEPVPLLSLRHAHVHLPFGHLRLGHQPAVVVLVPCDRGAPPLDGIGQKTDRAIVVDGGKGLGHGLDAVAAEIFHKIRQLVVRPQVDQRSNRPLIAQIVHQALAPDCTALKGKGGVVGVGTPVDPIAERVTAGFRKGRALQLAVLHFDHVPAKSIEAFLDPLKQSFVYNPIKRLTVVIHNPPDISQVVLPALLKAFIDVAFVQFCVTDQRDHSPLGNVPSP